MASSEPYSTRLEARVWFGRGVADVRHQRGTNILALAALAAICILTTVVPLIAPHSPYLPAGKAFVPPGRLFLLGTDEIGRDLLTRVLYGLRSTWWAALTIVGAAVVIGGLIGVVAGVVRGWVEGLLMRLTDTTLALPGPVIAIGLVAALGPSLSHMIIAMTLTWWTLYARIVHGEVVAIMARPHVEAARMADSGRVHLAMRHVLPGVVPPVLVAASLDIGVTVLALAALSFLGLGAPNPAPELGAMVERGLPYLLNEWWVPIVPGLVVFLVTLVANFAGDALRDLLPDR
jgi:peptide/nickel transport system permease protein